MSFEAYFALVISNSSVSRNELFLSHQIAISDKLSSGPYTKFLFCNPYIGPLPLGS